MNKHTFYIIVFFLIWFCASMIVDLVAPIDCEKERASGRVFSEECF